KDEEVTRICLLPIDPGKCHKSYKRYGYDIRRKRCVKFDWAGCGGNDNRFRTAIACRDSCENKPSLFMDECLLPIDPGNCEMLQRRYGYDKATGECVEFDYTGCEGNENRFRMKFECKLACEDRPSLRQYIGILPLTPSKYATDIREEEDVSGEDIFEESIN
ncbi:unnamed protein product, partial [Strongylus vulgaris]